MTNVLISRKNKMVLSASKNEMKTNQKPANLQYEAWVPGVIGTRESRYDTLDSPDCIKEQII